MNYKITIPKEERILVKILFSNKKVKNSDFEKLDYEKLIKITSSHLMLPALFINLKNKEYLSSIPTELYKYLKEIHEINFNRNEELIKEAKEISKIFVEEKINHIFIKGTANIFSKIYSSIGERMLNDIDILVDPSQLILAKNLLNKHKYISSKNSTYELNKAKHLPRLINNHRIFAIEIHRHLFRKRIKNFDFNHINKNKIIKNTIHIPSVNDQLINNIYNFQFNDFGSNQLKYSYKSYYDYFLINKKTSDKIKNTYYDSHSIKYFYLASCLDIPNFEFNLSNNKLIKARIKIKYHNKFFYLIDKFLATCLKNLSIRAGKFIELFKNRDYRIYLLNKININLFTSNSSNKYIF